MLIAAIVILALLAFFALRRGAMKKRAAETPALPLSADGRALPGLGETPALGDGATAAAALPALAGAAAAAGGAGLPGLGAGAASAGTAGAAPGAPDVPGLTPIQASEALPLMAAAAAGGPKEDEEAIEKVRQLASEMASKEPEAAARVLRGWLAEGGAAGKEPHA